MTSRLSPSSANTGGSRRRSFPSAGGTGRKRRSGGALSSPASTAAMGNRTVVDLTAFGFSRLRKRNSDEITPSTTLPLSGEAPNNNEGPESATDREGNVLAAFISQSSNSSNSNLSAIDVDVAPSLTKRRRAGKENERATLSSSKISGSTIKELVDLSCESNPVNASSRSVASNSSNGSNKSKNRRFLRVNGKRSASVGADFAQSNRKPLLDLTQDSSSDGSGNGANGTRRPLTTKKSRGTAAFRVNTIGSPAAPIIIHTDSNGGDSAEAEPSDLNSKPKASTPSSKTPRRVRTPGSSGASVASAATSNSCTQSIGKPPGRRKTNPSLSTPSATQNPITEKAASGSISSFFSTKHNTPSSSKLTPLKNNGFHTPKDTSSRSSNLSCSNNLQKNQVNTANNSSPSPLKTPSKRRPINAIGLVRVCSHNSIACTTAVAKARSFVTNSNEKLSEDDYFNTPRRLFPGAVLGRSSNSSKFKPNFVDLGIDAKAAGISRNALKVISVHGLNDSSAGKPQRMPLSQGSVASQSNTSSTAPFIMIQVTPSPNPNKKTNGVSVYHTRNGVRKPLFIDEGQERVLRIGDAVHFYSHEEYFYCVVGFTDKSLLGNEELEEDVDGECDTGIESNPMDLTQNYSPYETAETQRKTEVEVSEPPNHLDESKIAEESSFGNENIVQVDDPCKSNTQNISIEASLKENVNVQQKVPDLLQQLDGLQVSSETSTIKDEPMECDNRNSENVEQCIDQMDTTEMLKKDASIKKNDWVKVAYQQHDMFGDSNNEIYFGKVTKVKRLSSSAQSEYEICVLFLDEQSETFKFPSDGVQKLIDSKPLQPDSTKLFALGDVVDCQYQNEPKWYRGRVADLSEDGNRCNIMYYDGEYESNVPTKEQKIRFVRSCDETGSWLVGKTLLLSRGNKNASSKKETNGTFITGTATAIEDVDSNQSKPPNVNSISSKKCLVTFSDGSSDLVCLTEATKAVFEYMWNNCPTLKRKEWPDSSVLSMAERVRLRRQKKLKERAIVESQTSPNDAPTSKGTINVKVDPESDAMAPIAIKKETKKRPSRRVKIEINDGSNVEAKDEVVQTRSARKKNSVKTESTNSELTDIDTARQEQPKRGRGRHVTIKEDVEEHEPVEDGHYFDSQDSAYIAATFGDKHKAKDFHPSLPNMLWCSLNAPEAQPGANTLQNLLCSQSLVPPTAMIQKLFDLVKFGPKAEGSNVYFKEAFRTDLASQYATKLTNASTCNLRCCGTAIFGPSSLNDIEVLLSQSIDQTENLISGRRLVLGLQLAARGAKLLSHLLSAELHEADLSSVSSDTFNEMSLKGKPTIKLLKARGLRDSLKTTVRCVTKCLVRHSKWVLESNSSRLPSSNSVSDECSKVEAEECLKCLGSIMCYMAFLFCMESGTDLLDQSCAIVIREEFLNELERSIDDAPEINERNKNKYVQRLKLRFLELFAEDFAFPLATSVGEIIGFADNLFIGCID